MVHSLLVKIVKISSLMFGRYDARNNGLTSRYLFLPYSDLVHIVWETYNISVRLALRFSIPTIHILVHAKCGFVYGLMGPGPYVQCCDSR